MRRRRDKAQGIHDTLDLGRRAVEIAGELDLVVADLGDSLQRAYHVLGHAVADRIQLDADPFQAPAGFIVRRLGAGRQPWSQGHRRRSFE